jgi:sugar lactone lactonase YvrE
MEISSNRIDTATDLGELIGEATQLREVKEIALSGNKIEAIKRYREITGAGLKESKDAVEALMAGKPLVVSKMNVITPSNIRRVDLDLGDSSHQVTATSQPNTQLPTMKLNRAAVAAGGITGCAIWILVSAILLVVIVPILIAFTLPGGPLSGLWNRFNPVAFAQVVQSFGGEGNGPGLFQDPRNIAVDGSGYIYVADFSTGRIQRFDHQGTFQSMWLVAPETTITGLAATREGTVYVVYNSEIWRYNGTTGDTLGKVDLATQEQDYFFDDLTVVSDGSLLAIADGDTLVRFKPDGQVIQVIPQSVYAVSGDSELDAHPAVDGLGNAYILGTFNDAVFQYGLDGKFVNRFGSDGDENGQFHAPSEIAIDGFGRVFVSDINGIQVFSPDGRYLDRFRVEGYAFGLVFNDQNDLYVVTNKPEVFVYSINQDK